MLNEYTILHTQPKQTYMNMKRIVFSLTAVVLMLVSCSKGKNDNNPAPSNTITAKVNGTTTIFKVDGATLLRSSDENMKRLDITGISADGAQRIVITIGDKP